MYACDGKNHGDASRACEMVKPAWCTSAESSAVWTSATFPAPPISNTSLPPGVRRAWADLKTERRVVGSRKIQWRAALEKIFVKVSGRGRVVSCKEEAEEEGGRDRGLVER